MESTYFQDIIIPFFGWLVFVIILGAFVALAARTWRVFRRNELDRAETLGLPKGTIRSFIVITFTAIMFIIFFGFSVVEIPPSDRKWFLTAYGSILAFYFGTKYFPERFALRGMAISEVDPPVIQRPPSGTAELVLVVRGSGFESPKAAGIVQDGRELATSARIEAESAESVSIAVKVAHDSPVGGYDVWLDLANGSRVVRTAALTVIDSSSG